MSTTNINNVSYDTIISLCNSSIEKCKDALRYCNENGIKNSELIGILNDCIDICIVTQSLMTRDSEHGLHLAKECHEISDACADACLTSGVEYLEECRQHCISTASECRRMLIG